MSDAARPSVFHDATIRTEGLTSNAWPFEEARKIVKRLERTGKTEALFETGYGPSGLPHIGTFGEVARTTMVRNAFRVLTDDAVPTRLICFSDDMDGMRKIPENVPDRAALEPYLQKPLTDVPNPFGGEGRALPSTTMPCSAAFSIRSASNTNSRARRITIVRAVSTRSSCARPSATMTLWA